MEEGDSMPLQSHVLSRTMVVISGNCTVGMGDEAWADPAPTPLKSKMLFSNLALGGQERWIRGVQKRSELRGFIQSFWDGLAAEL